MNNVQKQIEKAVETVMASAEIEATKAPAIQGAHTNHHKARKFQVLSITEEQCNNATLELERLMGHCSVIDLPNFMMRTKHLPRHATGAFCEGANACDADALYASIISAATISGCYVTLPSTAILTYSYAMILGPLVCTQKGERLGL